MLSDLAQQLQFVIQSLSQHLPFLLLMLIVLWTINICNWMFDYKLNSLGILPRTPIGLLGIGFSPFLHGNFTHLFFNSIPLFLMAGLILIGGYEHFFYVSLMIILLGGFAIWLFARKGSHIGASTLVMGYWGYLLAQAIAHPSVISILVALITLYYFGGLYLNLVPRSKKVSWEGHLFGLLAGLAAALLELFH